MLAGSRAAADSGGAGEPRARGGGSGGPTFIQWYSIEYPLFFQKKFKYKMYFRCMYEKNKNTKASIHISLEKAHRRPTSLSLDWLNWSIRLASAHTPNSRPAHPHRPP